MKRSGAWGYRCTTCRTWVELNPGQARALTLMGTLDLTCPHCGMAHRESLATEPEPEPPPPVPVLTRPEPEAVPWKSIVPDALVAKPAASATAAPPPWEAGGNAAPLPFQRKPGRGKADAPLPPPPPPLALPHEPDAAVRPPRPRRTLGERFAAVPKPVQMAALFVPIFALGVGFIALTSGPTPGTQKSKAVTAHTARGDAP